MEPLDRSTIWPYDEHGEPGRVLLLALRAPDGRGGRRAPRRARRRHRAALPVGRGRDDGARPLAAQAGRHDRARRRRVLRHRRHLPGAREVGPPLRRVRPDRPAARRRAARLARGAVQSVPDDARPRGGRRASGAGRRRLDRRRRRSTCARSSTAPTSSCTARRSTSPGTTTRCSARSSVATSRSSVSSAREPASSPHPTRPGSCSAA